MSMKAMMGVAIALATVLASPAFAKTAASRHDPHNAYARSSNVYVDGHYVGSDPDPFIRDQLARDPGQGGNVWGCPLRLQQDPLRWRYEERKFKTCPHKSCLQR